MIEHILDSLIDVSNRILILDNGEVIYNGDPEEYGRTRASSTSTWAMAASSSRRMTDDPTCDR